MQQPVVEPAGEARNWRDVLMELADRLGFSDHLNELMNLSFGLKEPFKLDPDKTYSYEEVADLAARSVLGADKGLDWMRENGYYRMPRTVEQKYPLAFIKARFPVYFEVLQRYRGQVQKMCDEWGVPADLSDYEALVNWRPCPAFEDKSPEYDLFPVNYKVPFHSQSHTIQNPILAELGEHHPYAHRILINTETAKRKGINDGDAIFVESRAGRVKGRAKVSECVHPEVLGIAGVLGSWARGKPVAKGKGAHFNTLLPLTPEVVDWVSLGIDGCTKVKVYKAGRESAPRPASYSVDGSGKGEA